MSTFVYYTITPQPEKNPVAYIFRLFSETLYIALQLRECKI